MRTCELSSADVQNEKEDEAIHLLEYPNAAVSLCGKRRTMPSRKINLRIERVCEICRALWALGGGRSKTRSLHKG